MRVLWNSYRQSHPIFPRREPPLRTPNANTQREHPSRSLARRHTCGECREPIPDTFLFKTLHDPAASCRRPEHRAGRKTRVPPDSPDRPPDRLSAPVIVLDADDVVLAEIAAGLDLDQLQLNLAGVFQSMGGADRDVDRFVLVNDLDQFIAGDMRSASHHDPVFGARVMLLQREPAARP